MRKIIIILFVLLIGCSTSDDDQYDCGCTTVKVYDPNASDLNGFVNLRRCEFVDYEEADFNEMPIDVAIFESKKQGCK